VYPNSAGVIADYCEGMNFAGSEPREANRRISVALCTYNSGHYIDEQLGSILDQHRPVDEIVISDDGSTDDTLERVRRIAAEHPHGDVVRILDAGRAGGVIKNFQRALEHCTGDLVVLSDHDDVWRNDRIEKALAVMPADPAIPALVFSDARLVDENGDPRGRTLFQAYSVSDDELEWVTGERAFEVLGWRNIVTGATVMVNRALVDVALPLPERWIHDEWMAVLAAALGRILVIKEPLIDYRIHGRNQIGVPPRNPFAVAFIALKVGRERYHNLLLRTQFIDDRLKDAQVADEVHTLLAGRMEFEKARMAYGRWPHRRIRGIVKQWRSGRYRVYSRQPLGEALRDLLQRP